MLEKTSKEFRTFFFLQFTAELIRNSNQVEFISLKDTEEEKSKEKEIKKQVHEKLKEDKENVKTILTPEKINELNKPALKRKFPPLPKQALPVKKITLQTLRTPERLPPRLQYIQPIPIERQIDLGKLNPLIQDPFVQIIECGGTEQKMSIKGATGQLKTTNITLSEEEIKQVVEKFSKESKIPYGEGVFRVVVGKLNLSAIVSELVGSKFIIKKLSMPKTYMGYMQRQPSNLIRPKY